MVLAVVATLLSFVVSAVPAQAAVGVSASRTVSGFPRWFEDQGGTRLEPCFENDPARCVLLADAGFDPAQPLVFPTNFPGEFFYSVVDSDVISTPGCAGTKPGKALVRLALEGSFVGGAPVPGDQVVFARTRVTATGLCPNASYTFNHPYGAVTLTTDVDGQLARNQATTDIGCLAGGCTFTEPLTAPMFRGFLRWDPAVAPAATPGYLSGDAGVLHPIVGASGAGSINGFRVTGPGVGVASTNLFTVAAKVAGPLHSAPEAADFGNQPTNVPSPARTVTFTNVSQAPMTLTGAAVVPATAPWQVTASTCTGALAANATCTATLVFAPTALGAVTANLQIGHNSFRNPTLLPLSGAGTAAVAPDVTSAPATVDFRRSQVGVASVAQGVVVHNNGPGSYVVDGVSVADDVAGGGFTGDSAKYLPVAGNDCPAAGLAPGLSCTISVKLTPTGQRPTRAELRVAGHVGATSVPLTASLTGRGGIATSSAAGGVGPAGKGADGFPTWYQDDRGVRVKQCFLNDPTRCILLAEPTFNPAAAVAFPGNYPSEAFYYIADSDVMTTPGCGAASPAGRAGFRAAVEQTFVSGAVTAGEQMSFDRVRVNVTSGLCVGRVYKFVHPYGEFTFTADAGGGLPRSPGTIDTGCTPAPGQVCDFNLATASPVSDGFLRWDATAPAAPAGFLGDPSVLHTVAGAPYTRPGAATPQNRVEIIDTTDGSVVASTNLFTVSGQVDATQTATRYTNMAPSAYPQLSAGSPVDFGSQDVATTSAAKTVTVESVGTTGLTATAPAITGANAGDFRVGASTCGAVAVGAACTVTVTFTPTAPGTRTALLTVPSDAVNAWNGTLKLTGTGVGAAVAVIDVAPTALAFGDQTTASASAAKSVTVTNTGSAPLTVTGLALGGADAAAFTATGCTAAVAPGATCTVSVRFQPAASGARSATLTVTSNAIGTAPVVTLTGTGTAPAIAVTPAALTYAAQTLGTTSAAQTVTVSNPGTGPLTVSGLALAGTNAGDFTATGCTTPVAPAGTCTVSVTFAPTAIGARTATLTVQSDAVGAAPTPVTLSGTGVQPLIAVGATSVAFGSVGVATTAPAQTVTVTNPGTGPLTVSTLTLTGANAADFTASGCVAPVAPGGTCSVVVTFTPSATGARAATLSVVSNAPGAAPTVALSGTGVQSLVALAPASLAFGSVNVGAASAVQTVTVSNPGNAPLTVSGVTVAGANAADFAQTNTCATPVAPAGTCTVSVTFTPGAIGARTATLAVATNATVQAAAVPLSGTGLGAGASLSATSLAFGTRLLGSPSGLQTVTVTNTGNAPLVVSAVAVTGANPGDFTQTSTCTTPVAPAGTCTVSVAFTPAAVGARSASVDLTTNATPAVRSIAVTGTGTTAATATPASLVFAGQTVNTISTFQTVTVRNSGTAPLTFTSVTLGGTNPGDFLLDNGCFTVAVGATCIFNVWFWPKAPLAKSATVNLVSANGTLTVPLSGTGLGAIATLAPASAAFGSVLVGKTSAAQTFTLTNTGNAAMTNFGVWMGGWWGEYTQANTCPVSIAAGASCTITVAFKPTFVGDHPATVNMTTDVGVATANVTGTGIQPQLVLSPAFVAFPTQAVNVAWTPVTVTVSNPGTAPLTVSKAVLEGVNPTDYTVANGCTTPVTAGGTCTLTVGFAPAASGFKTANLVLTHDATTTATTTTTTVPLSGSANTAATVPGVTTLCCVTSGNGSVQVFWFAPSDGGAPVTQFVVQAYLAGTTTAVGTPQRTPGNVFNLVYAGLTNGTAYQFKVAAVNVIGTGPQSAASVSVTPATTPAAPATAPTLTQQNNQFGVSWSAATDNGGSPVTGYWMRVLDANGVQVAFQTTAGATSLTQCCLLLGSSYRAQVAAVNALGVGPWGPLSAATVFVARPWEPFIGAATTGTVATANTAGISWTPQAGIVATGGLPLTGFVVTAQQYTVFGVATGAPVVSALQPPAATRLDMTLPALATTGNFYRFSVQSVNAFGTSIPSALSAAVVPASAPAAPAMCCVSSGNASAQVSWFAAADNGSPVTGYTVQAYLAGTTTAVGVPKTTPGNVFTLAYTGLTNGTAYQFKVAAVNLLGTGPQSAASTSVTPATTPGAPVAPALVQQDAQFGISWPAATDTGGSPVTGYWVRVVDTNGVQVAFQTTAGATSVTQCCLALGATYQAQVAVVNALGVGPWGALSTATVFAARAQAPFIGAASAGAAGAPITAAVSWTPQTGAFGTGGLPLTGFVVTAQQYTAVGVLVGAPVVSGLQPATATRAELALPAVAATGNTYRFTVQAVNAVGNSLPSGQSAPVVPA